MPFLRLMPAAGVIRMGMAKIQRTKTMLRMLLDPSRSTGGLVVLGHHIDTWAAGGWECSEAQVSIEKLYHDQRCWYIRHWPSLLSSMLFFPGNCQNNYTAAKDI